MTLARAMRAAVMAHVGTLQAALVVPDDVVVTSYSQARDVLGTNAEIAEAAGYGAPGEYRKGSREWTRRKNFLRALQRGEQRRTGGTGQSRSSESIAAQVITVANITRNRKNTPTTIRDVIRLMGMKGTTTSLVKVRFSYEPTRDRSIAKRVYTSQPVYRSVEWPMRGRLPRTDEEWDQLGRLYLEGWSIAYGMGADLPARGVDNDPILQFTIGREEPIDYEESE